MAARIASLASQAESGYGSDFEDIDFHMPNGMVVPLKCGRHASIGSIKEELWGRATQCPGANLLRDPVHYVFIGVRKDAVEQEFEETTTFGDLDLVWPMLEVSVPKKDRDINRLYRIVGEVTGISIQSLDTTAESNAELRTHRILLKKLGRKAAEKRLKWPRDKQLKFFFPSTLDINPDLPYSTARLIMKANNRITVTAWMFDSDTDYSFDLEIAATDPPSVVVEKILRKKFSERYQSEAEIERRVNESRKGYVLKVCGREEYMLKECCVHAYKYFRNCINNATQPQLSIELKDGLYRSIPDNVCVMLQQDQEINETFIPPGDAVYTWDLPHTNNYTIKINNLPARKHENPSLEYYVEAEIFHGKKSLCKPVRPFDLGYKQMMTFNVSIQSLPRCARLCFVVCSLEKNKPFSEAKILGRLNVNIFDHNGVLVCGEFSKGIWESKTLENSSKFSPALVDGNPDRTALQLKYEIIPPGPKTVLYPPETEIDRKIQQGVRASSVSKEPQTYYKLDQIATYHPLQDLSELEKDFLWRHRDFVAEYNPNLLPWLYHSVNWLERHCVFEFYRLLKNWPVNKVLLSTALWLIGPEFVDMRTRIFAVQCIHAKKSTESLRLFLPQLIQAYRFDNYMKNDLGYFLLYQAWKDRKLGHDLFWHLRCEMSRAQCKQRFAPLLEAYCLYCGAAILDYRQREVEAMKKYLSVSREIKNDSQNSQLSILKRWLSDEETKKVLETMPSALDESIELGKLRVDECKVLMSKMRPLWLTWENGSRLPAEWKKDTIKYIVKYGDDLRQDKLVAQLLHLMDMFWKYTGSDYKLTPYDCLAMEDEIGLIEVVPDAHTVCDIEIKSEKGILAGMVSSHHIHEHLTSMCYQEKGADYLEMVNRFTMSCAGYCVATYLLGLGDRHSDNIMITKDGKLFHIDFGHFMNHKKKKGGVNRERTRFVVTNEFLHVINRGSSNSDKFEEFAYKCFEAFMTIRRNANLFLTLLQIMMHCEITELTENKDIKYFMDSLCLGKSEEKAAEDFFKGLLKSVSLQWTVKIDWMFHRINKLIKSKSTS